MSVTSEKHEAIVSKIEGFEDADEKRGVIEVICPGLMADDETPLPILCEPAHDWGWFYVPDVGEEVEIEVVVSSDRDESWGQSSLEALSPTWRGKRYHSDVETEGDAPRPIHVDYTETNYGKRRGFTTPWGHVFLFDDTEGDQRIYITHMAEQLKPGATPEPEKYTRIEIEPDGSLKVAFLNKHLLHFTTEKGNFKVALDGEPGSEKHTFEFDAETPKLEVKLAEGDSSILFNQSVPKLTVSMAGGKHILNFDGSVPVIETVHDGGAGMGVSGKDGAATTVFGDGAVKAAIADHLEPLWGSIVDYLDGHTHLYDKITVSGGSGAPAVGAPVPTETATPSQSAVAWDSNINGGNLTFPDN